jgi:NTP pyrophosphatase (non-canonical NTP hydrolase)
MEQYEATRTEIMFEISINNLVSKVYQQNLNAGWHSKPIEIGTCLMLIVSEIAEAMEGDRKSLMDDHLPHRKMLEVELADAVIRIMDLAGRERLDLGGAMMEKLDYNSKRLDHKLENREKEVGKKY